MMIFEPFQNRGQNWSSDKSAQDAKLEGEHHHAEQNQSRVNANASSKNPGHQNIVLDLLNNKIHCYHNEHDREMRGVGITHGALQKSQEHGGNGC